MPIFEYRCDECGAKFEKLVRNGDKVVCPSCDKPNVTQQFSTFAAHAKSSSGPAPAMCPSGGVCPTPGMCGRN
jgi:putative FmdB family regulatory protein